MKAGLVVFALGAVIALALWLIPRPWETGYSITPRTAPPPIVAPRASGSLLEDGTPLLTFELLASYANLNFQLM